MQKSMLIRVVQIVIIIGCSGYAIPKLVNQAFAGHPGARDSGFDLSFSLIRKQEILSGGPRKDGIPALTEPAFIAAKAADYLKSKDEVIGVAIGGQARAYPLKVMNWHEIVNDVVGGKPIMVTYCPLCRSALVFDRLIDGQVRDFGVSGRLWNSNVLMYDRQASPKDESLWSQIQMRAVTGPAAKKGLKLELLPSMLTTWREWQSLHPDTVVLSTKTGHPRNYGGSAYAGYFSNDNLMFPVNRQGERLRRFRNKEPMVIVRNGDKMKAYAVRDIAEAGSQRAYLEDKLSEDIVCLKYLKESESVDVELMNEKGRALPVAYMFWFSLNALLPEVEVYEPVTSPKF